MLADNQVLVSEALEDVTYMVRKLIEEFRKPKLEIRMKKTMYLSITVPTYHIENGA